MAALGTADARPLRRALLVLAAAWLVLFAPQLFARRVFVLGDARIYRPFAEYSRQRWLEQHERTFWNPFVMAGVAASASLADMRPQYLPDMALDVFERVRPGRIVPLAAPLLAILMGMWAMAALAWALWRPPAVALVWAGLAWGLSPLLLVPLAFGHSAYCAAVSLLPIMLLVAHALARAPTALRASGAAIALAGLAGLQALTGHPQVVAYSGAMVVAFALERAVRARRWSGAAATVLALAWGAGIAAAVWLPAIRYGAHSARALGMTLEQVRAMSIAWREVPALAFPFLVGGSRDTYWGGLLPSTDYPRFLGTLVVLFAVVGFLRRERSERDPRSFLAAVVAGALVLALGPRTGPVYLAERTLVPASGQFWVASMATLLAVPAMALLSAYGVAAMTAAAPGEPRHRRAPWPWLGALALLGVLLLTVASGGYAALAHAVRPDLPLALAQRASRIAGLDLVLRALLVALALLLLTRGRALRITPACLVALLAADLGAVSVPTLVRASGPETTLDATAEPALARFGREDHAARVLSTRIADVSSWETAGITMAPEFRTNAWIRWRARAFGGEHGSPSEWWAETAFLNSVEAIRALGVVYVSSPPQTPQDSTAFAVLERAPGEIVYRLRHALGRAYAVDAVRVLDAESSVVAAMGADGFRADSVALTLDAAAAGDYPGSAAARIEWLRDEPDELALRVEAAAPAFVVIADAWFPGWSAELDHERVPVSRVDHLLRGIAVPAGKHELRMRYRPEGWDAGVRVTRLALSLWLLSALAWLAWRFTSRRSL